MNRRTASGKNTRGAGSRLPRVGLPRSHKELLLTCWSGSRTGAAGVKLGRSSRDRT
jgi:hypothetical protein